MHVKYNMPPRGRKKKQLKEWWLGDTPEVKALGYGLRALRQHNAGYTEAQDEGNKITARNLAAKPDERNAKTAFMLGVPGHRSGNFLIGSTEPEVLKSLGIVRASALKSAFNKNKLSEDPQIPNFHRSVINGVRVMRSFHYPAPVLDYGEQELFDIVASGKMD